MTAATTLRPFPRDIEPEFTIETFSAGNAPANDWWVNHDGDSRYTFAELRDLAVDLESDITVAGAGRRFIVKANGDYAML